MPKNNANAQNVRVVDMDQFNRATLMLSGARSIIETFGILIDETTEEDGGIPFSGSLFNGAMAGVRDLIQAAEDVLEESLKRVAA